MHTDLRSWLYLIDNFGELKRISGFDCDLEMSAASEIISGSGINPVPCLIFDDIPGHAAGYRTLFGLFGSLKRVAITLGLPADDATRLGLLYSWRKKVATMKSLPPRQVSSAPILSNVDSGNNVDLLKFPVPRFHEQDGGRYIGTCHAVIQQDPDSGWVNLGTYRCMLVDKDHIALHILEGQHGSIIMNRKYFDRGKKMPVAIGIGLDPALWFAAFSNSVALGVSEYDYVGGVKGEPIEVISGEYTGLPLPAHAEIVIEGECSPGECAQEGPFGEWHGYYSNMGLKSVPEPVMEVKKVYYRDNPILTCHLPTMPCLDLSNLPIALNISQGIWDRLESAGIPGIKNVWCHSEVTGDGLFIVVSIEQMYPGHSRETGLIASQFPRQGRYTVVVEEDIDPSDIKQVIWAITTRSKPHEAIQILHRCRSSSADPTISIEEKQKYTSSPKPLYNSRVVIDACRPLEWKKDWYPVARMSDELRSRVESKVKDVLF